MRTGLPKHVAADLDHAQAVDLADARALGIDQQRALGDHLANFRFDEVVPLDLGFAGAAQVRGGDRRFARLPRARSRLRAPGPPSRRSAR